MVGVMAMAETYLTLWERGHRDVRGRAGRACALFDKGSRVFRFCRPSALRLRGHHAWLAGDTRRARRHWARALSESEALAMPFERGRVHFEIGRHGDAGDPATALHLSRSRRLFEQVEAAYWLTRLS
jgi:hypothetical protein